MKKLKIQLRHLKWRGVRLSLLGQCAAFCLIAASAVGQDNKSHQALGTNTELKIPLLDFYRLLNLDDQEKREAKKLETVSKERDARPAGSVISSAYKADLSTGKLVLQADFRKCPKNR